MAPSMPDLRPVGPELGLPGLGHLLALNGWKIERQQGIFGHGERGAFVASAEMRWETNFYPMPTTYATFATTSSRRQE